MTPENLVLLAEDEPNDALLFELAVERAGLHMPLVVAQDGQCVLDYLNAPTQKRSLPCLLVLDLKMPRLTGFQVLEWLASQEQFRGLPAVVLSSSGLESDQAKALALGAREYHVKPSSPAELVELVKRIHAKWVEGQGQSRSVERASLPAQCPP